MPIVRFRGHVDDDDYSNYENLTLVVPVVYYFFFR